MVSNAGDPIRLIAMSRRIDIELTSERPDGTWTWRAAGAQKPKGVLEGSILPDGAKHGDVLKVEADFEIEGISILSVVGGGRNRKEPTLLELIPQERSFEPVTQTLAKRDRNDRPRRDRDDRPRRDGESRGPRPEGARGPRPDGDRRGPRPGGPEGERRGPRPDRPSRPRFEPVPELPQRPRAKRLKPGKAHRSAVLADLPDEQRLIAEKALSGGIPAVRQAVNEQNASLRAEGKPEIPAAGLLKMAEELLPRLRVAEWLDRADAAKADLDDLDLRDLRSVVAAGDDPTVARDETTRALATELKAALATKQEKASQEWLEDIQLALGVGRVIRALKLSAEPPKAGMRFPADTSAQLAAAATASLTTDATADRWSAVLEAVAFSPVRAGVVPAAPPTQVTDELTATVTRLAGLVPQIAALFGITPTPGAPTPKPLRPTRKPEKKAGGPGPRPDAPAGGGRPGPKPPKPPTPAAAVTDAAAEAPPAETPAAETPAAEAPAADAAAADAPAVDTPTTDAAAAERTPEVAAAEPAAEPEPTPEAPAEPAAEVEAAAPEAAAPEPAAPEAAAPEAPAPAVAVEDAPAPEPEPEAAPAADTVAETAEAPEA